MPKIGVFDSGIGGLTVLFELMRLMPRMQYLYFMDGENCPYGERSADEIFALSHAAMKDFEAASCDVAVIACNTATACAVDKLRAEFHMPIVGTEPALKQAFGSTLLLATPRTLQEERVKRLAGGVTNLYTPDCADLAAKIQENFDEIHKAHPLLDKIIEPYLSAPVDCVVLGCTHYVFLREYIGKKFPNAKILDGNAAIAAQTFKVLNGRRGGNL